MTSLRRLQLLVILTFTQYSLIVGDEEVKPVVHFDRQINSYMNPGLESNETDAILMYIEAIGDKDVMHYIWDFTRGTPTALFAITDINVTLDFTWSGNEPNGFSFSKTPTYSFGLQFTKIWEFNDVNDTAIFDPNINQYVEFDCSNIKWEKSSVIQEKGDVTLIVVTHSIGKGDNKRVGDVTVKLDMFPYNAHALDLPHLIHTANSSLIDIILENITLSSNFNKSRFAIELIMTSADKVNGDFDIKIQKSLDDEHTPGVFEIIEIVTPETYKSGNGGYVQYRPVIYNKPSRDVECSDGIHMSSLEDATIDDNSIVSFFFSNLTDTFNILSKTVSMTFGTQEDGFFKKTNYTAWSFAVGYGTPPVDNFSAFLIILLGIGLGVPALLCALGGICIYFKKDRVDNEPRRLVEE